MILFLHLNPLLPAICLSPSLIIPLVNSSMGHRPGIPAFLYSTSLAVLPKNFCQTIMEDSQKSLSKSQSREMTFADCLEYQ